MERVNWPDVIERNRDAILATMRKAAWESEGQPDGYELRLELHPDGEIVNFSEPRGCLSLEARRGKALLIERYPGGRAWDSMKWVPSYAEKELTDIQAREEKKYRLFQCATRDEGAAYVEGLGLTIRGLKDYAASLGLTSALRGSAKANKIRDLVERTLGQELDRQAFCGGYR